MSDPSIPAHMSQRSQLDRTHAALGRHVEDEEALAELEGEMPTQWEAFTERRHWILSARQRYTHLPAPQHDWLLNIETPGYMEVA
tara:strand:- start:674 stop:928 length:255 start_codon:yes stop_codon:yes gene_type:complete